MAKPDIKTTKPVVPMIYAYTTPGIPYHDGYIKIGYTEQDVDFRIWQQTHTAGIKPQKEWWGTAMFETGTGEMFRDARLHAYLRRNGIKQPQDLGNEYFDPDDRNEWFYTDKTESYRLFSEFRMRGDTEVAVGTAIPYKLRVEQDEAVSKTFDYFKNHANGEFLWNAKPRFGKTLSAYDLCKRLGAKSVLIVTNRPAIANSWYEDYVKFLGEESGYRFVSGTDALKGQPYVFSREAYLKSLADPNLPAAEGFIEFISLQDLKGSKYFSTNGIDKLEYIASMNWDLLIVDEAHEGVDTYKTDTAFDQIKRKNTLHLSGTPFKAIANEKFPADAIYNWTYADEQSAKRDWNEDSVSENPYADLPKLNLFTYQMSEIVKDELKQGIDIEGENYEYAFDLNEFFATDERGAFRHGESVDKFLDALTKQEKFPFSTPELRDEIKHSFWLLNRVDSAKALARKLAGHPVFSEYEIILAAGDGKLDDTAATEKSYDKVVNAIAEHEKTITISVGQLTTGVTIPEWTAVLMLSNIQSPALYMQAAFRAQNPCLFTNSGKAFRKENAYVFDFDPARTLIKIEQFANDLYAGTAGGKGDSETRKENVKELLNFFPVIGEDENGEMIPLDAEKVLTIPRKIKSTEVVKRGFMSNYLFQNISNVFGAPGAVAKILEQLPAVKEIKLKKDTDLEKDAAGLSLNKDGEVEISEEHVEEKTNEVFGAKVYKIEDLAQNAGDMVKEDANSAAGKLTEAIKQSVISDIVSTAQNAFGEDIKRSDKNAIERKLNDKVESLVNKKISDLEIKKNHIQKDLEKALESGRDADDAKAEFTKKLEEANNDFVSDMKFALDEFVKESKKDTIRTAETKIEERKKNSVQDDIRDHLRGFARTIPSFLMAYGDDSVTLATFDEVIPGEVFVEVTSITLDQFKFLRDGGDYEDPETGETKHFAGNLFDPIVFDDSVKEFLRLKKKLADYFDEKTIEDIFDYIPPQKTNQIYTPKLVVKKMVDMLEAENPGCFDKSENTFIDPYMKSGLYITEIVKRLYQSKKMKELFPDDAERLKHIFAKQVYGLAPTEIIYNIAKNYILGFSDEIPIEKHNIKLGDSLPHAKAGDLESWLDEVFKS